MFIEEMEGAVEGWEEGGGEGGGEERMKGHLGYLPTLMATISG